MSEEQSGALWDDTNRIESPPDIEDLPPVEPPSAGFIVQLFVVPMVIVTVVVGIYVLFGKLASGQQDWRQQLTDLRSDNPHIRWRGAHGLAQMLQADTRVPGDQTRLAENREVAKELSDQLSGLLTRSSRNEEDLKHQEFLARTLGLLDVTDVVLPTLGKAAGPHQDREVRKNALASAATIADRFASSGRLLDDSLIIGEVITASDDADSLVRHTATFTLGLLPSPDAEMRLRVLVEHPDEKTRFNAAVGLARRHSLEGLPVFESVLESAPDWSPGVHSEEEGLERTLMLTNTIRALSELRTTMTPSDRRRVADLLQPISRNHPTPRLRVDATTLLQQLGQG